jgi:serine O-acetyltransferase
MIITIGKNKLEKLLIRQLTTNFFLESEEEDHVADILPEAISKSEICFQENIQFGSYWDEEKRLIFNPYNSGQYNIFLYLLAREAYSKKQITLADKFFYLNKLMNGCEIHYRVQMPKVFCPSHSVGAVIGMASFQDYFVFQQNCTVGGNHGIFPTFGKFVRMFANSMVIGKSVIGNNVFISSGAFVKDEIIPDNNVVFGHTPNLVLKEKPTEYFYKLSFFREHKKIMNP